MPVKPPCFTCWKTRFDSLASPLFHLLLLRSCSSFSYRIDPIRFWFPFVPVEISFDLSGFVLQLIIRCSNSCVIGIWVLKQSLEESSFGVDSDLILAVWAKLGFYFLCIRVRSHVTPDVYFDINFRFLIESVSICFLLNLAFNAFGDLCNRDWCSINQLSIQPLKNLALAKSNSRLLTWAVIKLHEECGKITMLRLNILLILPLCTKILEKPSLKITSHSH